MILIIAGSRGFHDYEILDYLMKKEILTRFQITEIVSGNAQGADRLGELWAKQNSVHLKLFIPDWLTLGRAAGPIRNEDMAKYADAVLALWDGESQGTKHMINSMIKKGKPAFVYNEKMKSFELKIKDGR